MTHNRHITRLWVIFAAVVLTGCSHKTYVITSVERTRVIIDERYDDTPHAAAQQFVSPYRLHVDSIMSPVVGRAARHMAASRPESPLSNLLADILVWAGTLYDEQPSFAVYNMGGIRAALTEGDITYGDVVDVAPFENKITFLTLTGRQVTRLFAQIASTGGEGVSRGVEITAAADGTLSSARLHGDDIDPDALYRVATLDYLAQGNDRMTAFKDAVDINAPDDENSNIRYIIISYLQQLMRQGKAATADIEGRLTIDDNGTADARDAQPSVEPVINAGDHEGHPYNAGDHEGRPYSQLSTLNSQLLLTVLHTNDTHSCIMPLSPNLADTLIAGRGGYLRRAAMIERERADDPSLLLFDSGDFSQGSPYYTLYKGDVEVGLMNIMGYDAATIGNHEFDFGLDNMARLFRMAQFPIVCANYDFTGTPVEGLVKPYVIIRRNGLKIGVFGLAPELDGLVMARSCEGVGYLDPIATATDMVKTLKKKKCDIIVCLSHLGWDLPGIDDTELIPAVTGIDIVLGGHSHTYMKQLEYVDDAAGKAVPVDQNGKHGAFIGKINIGVK